MAGMCFYENCVHASHVLQQCIGWHHDLQIMQSVHLLSK